MKRLFLAAAMVAAASLPALAGTQGVTKTEIKIGTYTDLSGVTAMWGVNNSDAWRMVFDAANAKGGIYGRKIHYIVEDNQYQVPLSIQAENKLLNEDHVFVEVANGGTPMNNATMPMQLKAGVPNVFPLTSARSMYEPFSPLKFALGSSYYDQVRAGIKYFVQTEHKSRVCAASEDTDFGKDIMDGVHAELAALHMKLAAVVKFQPTAMDFSADVAKLHAAKCDMIVFGTIVRDTIQLISAVHKSGWNPVMMGQAASYDSAVASAPGGVTDGFYSVTPMLFVAPNDPRPAVKAFVAAFHKRYGKDPNFAAQLGYTGAQIVLLALHNAGPNLTTASFIHGLEAVKGYHDIFGSPTISFGPHKHQGSNESFLCVVKNGVWVPVMKTPITW